MDALALVTPLSYRSETYTLRLLQSIEHCIVFESIQHRIRGQEPDDVAQELRIHIYNKIHLYNPTKDNSFKTWSDRVIRNKLIDMGRARGDLLDHRNAHAVDSIHELNELE